MGTVFLTFSARPRSASDVGRALLLLEDAASAVRTAGRAPASGDDYLQLVGAHLDGRAPALELSGEGSEDLWLMVHHYTLQELGTQPAFDRALLLLTEGLGVGEQYEWLRLATSAEGAEQESITLDAAVRERLRSSAAAGDTLPPALAAANAAFHARPTLAELAERQGVTGPVDVARLYDAEATDAERDAFMAAIAELG